VSFNKRKFYKKGVFLYFHVFLCGKYAFLCIGRLENKEKHLLYLSLRIVFPINCKQEIENPKKIQKSTSPSEQSVLFAVFETFLPNVTLGEAEVYAGRGAAWWGSSREPGRGEEQGQEGKEKEKETEKQLIRYDVTVPHSPARRLVSRSDCLNCPDPDLGHFRL
jgi:hypothetical protein